MSGRAASLAAAAIIGLIGHLVTWMFLSNGSPLNVAVLAGLAAGLAAGAFTLWSRIGRTRSAEFGWTIATAFVGVAVWWATLCSMSIVTAAVHGESPIRGTYRLTKLWAVVVYAVVACGPVVLTACWAARRFVWWLSVRGNSGR